MAKIETRQINCGSCGAPIELKSAFTKSIVCPFCDTTNIITDMGVDPTGRMAKIAEAPSVFKIGRTGTLKGRKFEVLGRLRYGYDEGFWDEWFLQFEDGQCGWVTEEEGEMSLFFKELLTEPIEDLENIRVGKTVKVQNKNVFVTEITDAVIKGGEGELHYPVVTGKTVTHYEGNSSGKLVSIELWPKELEVHTGEPILYKDLNFDEKDDL